MRLQRPTHTTPLHSEWSNVPQNLQIANMANHVVKHTHTPCLAGHGGSTQVPHDKPSCRIECVAQTNLQPSSFLLLVAMASNLLAMTYVYESQKVTASPHSAATGQSSWEYHAREAVGAQVRVQFSLWPMLPGKSRNKWSNRNPNIRGTETLEVQYSMS